MDKFDKKKYHINYKKENQKRIYIDIKQVYSTLKRVLISV